LFSNGEFQKGRRKAEVGQRKILGFCVAVLAEVSESVVLVAVDRCNSHNRKTGEREREREREGKALIEERRS